MAERGQNHTHDQEKTDQQAQIKLLLRGQYFAFIVAITALISGCVLIALGSKLLGSVLALGSLVGCAALYIRGEFQHRQNSEKER